MLDRLATSRERQRAFVADAAHELRSPLASMRTQLEVAQRLGEGGDAAGGPARRRAPARPAWSRTCCCWPGPAPTRGAPSRRESFDALPLLADVAGRYAAARVPVRRRRRARRSFVSADREELRRVLSNLVDNGVRHASTRVVAGRRGQRRARPLLTVDRRRAGHPARPTGSGSSTGSPGSTTPAPATPAAPAWAWPSSGSCCGVRRHDHPDGRRPGGRAAGRGAAPPLTGSPAGARARHRAPLAREPMPMSTHEGGPAGAGPPSGAPGLSPRRRLRSAPWRPARRSGRC